MIGKTVYYKEPGKKNTENTLKIAKKRAKELGIDTIIISSSGGYSANLALQKVTDQRLIIVGFSDRFPEDLKKKLESKGHKVLFSNEYKFDHPSEAWELLRRFGEGMKVAVQIVLMATEVGLVNEGVEVIALGGTGMIDFPEGGGCDLAIVMEAVKGENFFQITLPTYEKKMKGRKIKEILCKPR
ncbi:MAG: hypothetical protein ACXAEX_22090 [Promethearchaeota archaeon]|jgi:hypothetical protein